MANECRSEGREPSSGTTSLRFAAAARVLCDGCRDLDLVVPGFRSPPRASGVHRSVRRYASGGSTVSVLVRGRPWGAVLADMIEGVVVTNQLAGRRADEVRTALWSRAESADLAGPLPLGVGPAPPTAPRQRSSPDRPWRSVAPAPLDVAVSPDAA